MRTIISSIMQDIVVYTITEDIVLNTISTEVITVITTES